MQQKVSESEKRKKRKWVSHVQTCKRAKRAERTKHDAVSTQFDMNPNLNFTGYHKEAVTLKKRQSRKTPMTKQLTDVGRFMHLFILVLTMFVQK